MFYRMISYCCRFFKETELSQSLAIFLIYILTAILFLGTLQFPPIQTF